MRALFVVIHRWAGLFTAAFLFVAGATGAVIAWDHELDAWLNPSFHRAPAPTEPFDAARALALADALEAREPELQVTYLPLGLEAGDALNLFVGARNSDDPDALPFNQLALEPQTGAVQARRKWGEASLARESFLPFLYKLHYSMHLPSAGMVDLGVLLMGVVAVIWTLDSFIALVLAFPSRAQWRKSFAFRLRAGGYRLIFDLHRSGGVWAWGILLTLAVTAVSMNLRSELVRPIVSTFSELSPKPYERMPPRPLAQRAPARLDRREAVRRAEAEASRLGIAAPAGGLFYNQASGYYGVGFFAPGNDHGDGGLGNPWVYLSDQSGEVVAREIPGTGSAGDVFMAAQFPLHSGRIAGVTGRVLVSLLGLVVALLSATGVVIWLKKRVARRRARERASLAVPGPAPLTS